MATIPFREFSKNFWRTRKIAQRKPKAYAVEELSENTIQAITASKMDARHTHLNSLLDE